MKFRFLRFSSLLAFGVLGLLGIEREAEAGLVTDMAKSNPSGCSTCIPQANGYYGNGYYGNGFFGNGYYGNGFYGNGYYGNGYYGNGYYGNGYYGNGYYGNGYYGNGYYGNGYYGNGYYGNGYFTIGLTSGDPSPPPASLPFTAILSQPLSNLWSVSGVEGAMTDSVSGGFNIEMLKYFWKCAMPVNYSNTVPAGYGYIGSFYGAVGIAPEWYDNACDTNCQEKVSACLLALTNVYHRPVTISLCAEGDQYLGNLEPCGSRVATEVIKYNEPEGRFFGNFFDSTLTYNANSCSDLDNSPLPDHVSGRACMAFPESCHMHGMGSCDTQPWLNVSTGTPESTGTKVITNVVRTYLDPNQVLVDGGCGDFLCGKNEVRCAPGDTACPPAGKINCPSDCASEAYLGVHGPTTAGAFTYVTDIQAYDDSGKVVYVGMVSNGGMLEDVPSSGQPAAIPNSNLDMFLMVRDGATPTRLTRFAVGGEGTDVALSMAVGRRQIFVGGMHFVSAFDKRSLTPQWTINAPADTFTRVWLDPDGAKVHATGWNESGNIHRAYSIADGATVPSLSGIDWEASCQSPTGELFGIKRAGEPLFSMWANVEIQKFDATGSLVWSVIRPAPSMQRLVDCRVTQDGSTLVIANGTAQGASSGLMTVDASTGTVGWTKSMVTVNHFNKFEITTMVDTVDDYIVVGGKIKGASYPNGSGEGYAQCHSLYPNSGLEPNGVLSTKDSDDAFVAAYNVSDGCMRWLRREAGVGHDWIDAFAFDAKARLCIAGTFPGTPVLEGKLASNNHGNATLAESMVVGMGPLAQVDTDVGSSCVALTKNVTDFNNDGKSDLFWRHMYGTSSAWTMNGFESLQQGTFYPFQSSDWQVVGTQGDFNGDGKSDLLWWNASARSAKITLMNGTTIASDGVIPYAVDTGPGWAIVDSTGDYDNDGKSDILWWSSSQGTAFVGLHDGVGTKATAYPFVNLSGWEIKSAGGDYNGDGKSDILLWNEGQKAVYVALMNGVSILQEAYAASGIQPGWSIVDGKGDYDGDGKSDILWHHAATGGLWQYLVDGTSIRFDDSGPLESLPSATWTVVDGTADFNGDGKSDIVFKDINRDVKIRIMNGATHTSTADYVVATNAAFGPNHDWNLASAHHDVNGDGKADLLGTHIDGSVSVWQMDGANILNSAHIQPQCNWIADSYEWEPPSTCVVATGQDPAYWFAQLSWPNSFDKATASIHDVMGSGDSTPGSALAALQPVTTTARFIAAMLNAHSVGSFMLTPDMLRDLWNNPGLIPQGYPSVNSFLESTWAY